ncbi:MAG: cupin domain-containing protein [Anaerolineales bacterium]|nr:cupin domain-containing protein [Anaerolineales bacterium]
MTEQIELQVGARIKEIRMAKGLALRSLAEKCDLSANAISLIERGENSPTVSSLHKLSLALEVPITDFFVSKEVLSAVHVKKGQGMKYGNGGLLLESLATGLPNQQLEPFRLSIEPGSGTVDDPIVHSGQEFVYCLTGEIEYYVDGQAFCLIPGDSLLLEASCPHSWRNSNQQPATILLIFQATSESHLARQRHLEL